MPPVFRKHWLSTGCRWYVTTQEINILAIDLFEQSGNIFVIKWKSATEHDIEDDSATPYINLWTCVKSVMAIKVRERNVLLSQL
jgi:hypothetical protein